VLSNTRQSAAIRGNPRFPIVPTVIGESELEFVRTRMTRIATDLPAQEEKELDR
jgi:hypothetical protein